MSEGKLVIVGSVLRKTKPFRPTHIVQDTGMSRQLVEYHLKALCELGGISKQDKYYQIEDRDLLVNAMVDAGLNSKRAASRLKETRLIDKKKAIAFNERLRIYTALRALGFEGARLIKEDLLSAIEDSEKALDAAKRYVNSHSLTVARAAEYLNEFNAADLWVNHLGELIIQSDLELDRDSFEDWLGEEVNKYL